ncbi:MAG: nicotinamide-nucleotide amidohydrolase family protein [Sphingomonadaceae bacterium]|jgi:nicotinamide-nucleotide amidase
MSDNSITHLVSQLGNLLLPRNCTLAVAESCTGGMLASAIVSDVDASPILERAFIVYSIDAKCDLLGLDRQRVEECEGVAEDVARTMAEATLANSRADLAVAITGFAGPREGDEEVGLIHLATSTVRRSRHQVLHLGDIGRLAACRSAVETALYMLLDEASSILTVPRISGGPRGQHHVQSSGPSGEGMDNS